MNRADLILILRVILGGVFIFSGVAKLDSIYQFEQMIFKAGVTNWDIIPYLSRFTIAAEIFLGVCFFHEDGLKKFTIPATFIMLTIFSVHLGYTIITEGGSSGNCGCFGEKIKMTPNESLIKNIVMLGLLVFLYKAPTKKPFRQNIIIPLAWAVLSLYLVKTFFPIKPYVTNSVAEPAPVTVKVDPIAVQDTTIKKSNTKTDSIKNLKDKTPKELNKGPEVFKAKVSVNNSTKIKDEPIKDQEPVKPEEPKLLPKTTSKYAPYKNFSDGNTIDLDEGIKVVTMYNTGCEHCMENAKKMCELSKSTTLPPVRILFWGNESEIPAFFNYAKCNNPYKFLEPQVFFPLLGKGNFPKIILLNNGNVIGEWEGDDATDKLNTSLKEMKYK